MEPPSNRCPKCGEVLPTFGFTHEMVETLRSVAAETGYDLILGEIRDRIEALLPPEKEGA